MTGMAKSMDALIPRLTLGVILLGVIARVFRYLLSFPIWGDEAYLCLNVSSRDFLGLTAELEHNQIAPVLFLWGQKAVYLLLGGSNYAMRLLPLVAGVAALPLFWLLARRVLSPFGTLVAVGFLAVARWPITMATLVKPYSLDLLCAIVLLLLAVEWLRRPDQRRWLVGLAVAFPLAVGLSYPSVFVAGGVSLALLPALWRQRRVSAWVWFVVANGLLVAAFVGQLALVGRHKLDPTVPSVEKFMADYWQHGFPPGDLRHLPGWLLSSHTGTLFAYPFGDNNGGSILTVALFVVGIAAWWRGQRTALVLCLVPFALNLVAAALHRYPYAAHARLTQHLTPAVCLLAAAGLAALLERLSQPVAWRRAVLATSAALALLGVLPMLGDARKPYRDNDGRWAEGVARQLGRCVRPNDQVVVLQPRNGPIPTTLVWQMSRIGARWGGDVDWQRLHADGGRLWCVNVWTIQVPFLAIDGLPRQKEQDALLGRCLGQAPTKWVAVDRVTYQTQLWDGHPEYYRCDVYPCVEADRPRDPITALPGTP